MSYRPNLLTTSNNVSHHSPFTTHHSQKKRAAFTLAEVLITLGIIGVVAAMTMPVLIQHNRNTIAETRLKKFYTTINQAILMSVKDNGDYQYWDFWTTDTKDDEGNYINQDANSKKSFEKYLAPYLKITGTKQVDTAEGDKYTLYYLADGSAFSFALHENRDWTFYPDKAERCIERAFAGERVMGICRFNFSFMPNSSGDSRWKYHYKKGLEPHKYEWDGNISTLYTDSLRGCNPGNGGSYCAAIIQLNGWRIPDDYPRKISY